MDKYDNKYINEEIRKHYHDEDLEILAKRLGISYNALRKRASRMGVKKGTISNEITVDGLKLCCICNKMKPISSFRKDRCQPNNIDYRCKQCRKEERKKEDKRNVMLPDGFTVPYCVHLSKKGTLAFHHNRTINPVVYKDGIPYIRCRGFCKKLKTFDAFSIDRKMTHGHVNYCKKCMCKMRELNTAYTIYKKNLVKEEE